MAALLDKGLKGSPCLTRDDYVLVAVLALTGLALRLPGLNQGLWIDEILTLVKFVRLPASEIINQSGSLNNHVLYSLSAHYFTTWFGESAWTLRLPALLFGVATIPALYYLGRQVASRQEAFLATLFLTLNYHHVWFSQNARGYTGLALGAVLATILFIRLLTNSNPRTRLIIGYAVVAGLSTWVHLAGSLVVLAHALLWISLSIKPVSSGRLKAVMPTAAALALAGLFSALICYQVIAAAQGVSAPTEASQLNNMFTYSLSGNSPGFISNAGERKWLFEEFAVGLGRSMPGGWVIGLAAIGVFLAGAISYARQGIAVLGLLLLPVLCTFVAIAGFAYFFFPRFIFNSLPLLVLLAVRGGFNLATLTLPFLSQRQVLVIGIACAMLAGSKVQEAWKPKQDFNAAAHFIAENRSPGDVVICLGLIHLPINTYLGEDCDLVSTISELELKEKQHERIWVLYTLPGYGRTEVKRNVQTRAEYKLIKEFDGSLRGGDISVLLRQEKPQDYNDS